MLSPSLPAHELHPAQAMDSPIPPTQGTTRNPKRRRTAATEAFASRKRAAKACHFCRLRKTKCDNRKPVCSFCQANEARCVWDDEGEGCNLGTKDPNQDVLQRLDELKATVNSLTALRSCHCHGTTSYVPKSTTPEVDSHDLPRCESLVRWPIFQAFLTKQERLVQSFVLESDMLLGTGVDDASTGIDVPSRRALIQEEVVPLTDQFFEYINPRNPILDAQMVKAIAARIAEDGFGWDNESCLILLICALAHYSKKWTPDRIRADAVNDTDQSDYQSASAYFIAAKKRIGLLGDTTIDVQCLFLAHIYEKCALRAVEASYYVQQASIRLQVCISRAGASCISDALMDRLFWSVTRAESELLPELGLQPSGLRHPGPGTCTSSSSLPTLSLPSPPPQQEYGPEQGGWFFYLAEITIRRTMPEMVALVYEGGHSRWLADISTLVRRHAECDRQINELRNHVPVELQCNSTPPTHELAYFLTSRFVECQRMITLPFLYYTVHATSYPIHDAAVRLAQDCVGYCAETIKAARMMNRHGGTWFGLRGLFTSAMMLLAAMLESDHLQVPEDWEGLVQSAVETLHLWSPGVSDVKAMRLILEKVFVCTRASLPPKLNVT